jgi:hypothetical protein
MVILVDVGTLAHSLRKAGTLIGASDRAYHRTEAQRKLLERLHEWPTGDQPADVEVLVSTDDTELNRALSRWRNIGVSFNSSGYQFRLRRGQIGLATYLYWWLVFDVPGMWLQQGIPQVIVLPSRELDVFSVAGRDAPVVRVPLKKHGTLWLAPTAEPTSEVELANAALDIIRLHRAGQRRPVLTYRHVLVPVFAGYQDARVTWLNGWSLHGQRRYSLGPIVQHMRVAPNMFGVPQSSDANDAPLVNPATTLALNTHLVAFVTPPSDPFMPYAVMSIGASDWTQSW